MSQLIIPIGIPGCGKSTWANAFFNNHDDVIWSSDDIRARPEFGGDVNNQTNNDKVFKFFHEQIQNDLVGGARVVADATNLTLRARRELLEDATVACVSRIHVVIFTNVAQAFARNERRERTVPHQAMMRMLDQYERMRLTFHQERSYYTTVTEIGEFS